MAPACVTLTLLNVQATIPFNWDKYGPMIKVWASDIGALCCGDWDEAKGRLDGEFIRADELGVMLQMKKDADMGWEFTITLWGQIALKVSRWLLLTQTSNSPFPDLHMYL